MSRRFPTPVDHIIDDERSERLGMAYAKRAGAVVGYIRFHPGATSREIHDATGSGVGCAYAWLSCHKRSDGQWGWWFNAEKWRKMVDGL